MCAERYGYERLIADSEAKLVQEDDFGRLWRVPIELDGEELTLVEVVKATVEPDGTRRRYLLRVPPTVKTARAAVAWTFEIDQPNRYAPVKET